MKLCANSVNIRFIQLCFYHKVACFFFFFFFDISMFLFCSVVLIQSSQSMDGLCTSLDSIHSIFFQVHTQATILCIFFSFDNPNNLGAPHQPERSTDEHTGYKRMFVVFLCCVQSLYY